MKVRTIASHWCISLTKEIWLWFRTLSYSKFIFRMIELKSILLVRRSNLCIHYHNHIHNSYMVFMMLSPSLIFKHDRQSSIIYFNEFNQVKEKNFNSFFQYSILKKAAKSTCIIKNTYMLGKVMDAKTKENMNLYFSKYFTLHCRN